MTWTSEFVMSFAHPSRIDLHPFISSSRIKLKPLKMLNPLLQINAICRRALAIRQDQHSLVGCHQFLHAKQEAFFGEQIGRAAHFEIPERLHMSQV